MRLDHSWLRYLVPVPFLVSTGFFLSMAMLTIHQNASGLAIALVFIATLLVTAFVSRYLRSKELRFEGFTFADEHTQKRWDEIRQLHFQVLVPHRPAHLSLPEKDREIRSLFRLGPDVPILFIEAELGDPSDFFQTPVMHIFSEDGLEVIRVTRCASIPHVLASLCLEFSKVGKPPEIYFDWSNESAFRATLSFLLWGEGNVPLLVHELIHKAEKDPARQPRIILG